MKNKFLKAILSLMLVSTAFVGCVNDDDYSVPQIECNETNASANLTIAQLKAAVTPTATLYTASDTIEARIVSSDKGGNFYKLIYMNSLDGSIGFSVAVNQTSNYEQYNVGRKVYVSLKGLYVQLRNSTIQIGALYNGNVGQIAATDVRKHIIRSCDVVEESTLVQEMELANAINNDNIGKLIELTGKETGVQFVDASLGQTYYNAANVIGSETNHIITDPSNSANPTLIFRTGSFAEYAGLAVSPNSGKIRGILTKFNNDFQFVARYETDIKLTEDRIGELPVNPEPEPEPEPEPVGTLLFAGGDFENWSTFIGGINSQFGLKPYAVESAGNGINGSIALHLSGTPTANDYVFTAKAPAGLPANPTKITFWVKGTSGKSLSLNVNRATSGFEAFNVGDLGTSAVTINKNPELNPTSGSGANQYVGVINTNNQWVKITLNVADMSVMTTAGSDFFSLKVGRDVAYDLYLDNFEIE